MPDEKLEFSAQDLGRFAASLTPSDASRSFVLVDLFNWLRAHSTSPEEYDRVRRAAHAGYDLALDDHNAERLRRWRQVAPDGPSGGVSAPPPGSRRESDLTRAGSPPSVVGTPSDSGRRPK